jgi:hypothetical protein
MFALFREVGISERYGRIAHVNRVLAGRVESSSELTFREVQFVSDELERDTMFRNPSKLFENAARQKELN